MLTTIKNKELRVAQKTKANPKQQTNYKKFHKLAAWAHNSEECSENMRLCNALA